MSDVVDSGELLRRLQRAKTCANEELLAWRTLSQGVGAADPAAARDAHVRVLAYETVVRVLDEIVTPGRHAEERRSGE
ncbi:hypothetical protein OG562_42810 [Streptomyces sp. NBC_01275]|uniref:hypothetical protein n=1 Tax=Streptomyces sp. NBC_01275 TaxID=2903807 RepID=UPI0022547D36|nr:hypothetical protein [Streptomyces sp. NBC_01275]MCX4767573.1 hypothetical protein [Streptomyces sp. NBC_01275]